MRKTIFICLIALLSGLFCGNAYADAINASKKKQLAIINSYNEGAPWPRTYINYIVREISMRDDFNTVRITHLSNILIHNEEDYIALEDKVFASYEERPDYLVLIGNFSFNLRDRIKEEWGDIPILLICMSDKYAPLDFYFTLNNNNDSIKPPKFQPLDNLRNQYNFSAVFTPNKPKETVDMMLGMFPDMRKLVFMGDGLYINRHLSHVIREYLDMKYPDVEYEWLLADEDAVMMHYLNNTDPNIGLLLSTWYYTAIGIHGYPVMRTADSFIINGAKRPVFGMRSAYMGYGLIGGYFVSNDEVFANVEAALSDLISGKRMSEVPFRFPTQEFPYINYSKLQDLGLPESICPENTVFVEKPITFWDKYSQYIIIGGIVLALLLIFYIIRCYLRRRPRLRKAYDTLVNSMPIGYMQVVVNLDRMGNVKKVKYVGQNQALKTLMEEHDIKELKSEEFTDYWQETADTISADDSPKGQIVKAIDDDTYIEFLLNKDPKSTDTRILLDVFAIDVSDKMKVEQVLREAARKAVEADSMKTAFLANMSHEIRTPLNAIVGFSNLLCKTDNQEKKKKYIEIIETNNQLLLKLIGDILDISKADSDKLIFNMHTVDINKLLTTVCNGVDLEKKPDVRIEVRPGLEQCMITSDPYRITQVLNNLLTNAIKFTERGTITVGYDLTPNNMLRFYVKDQGLGISASDMPKLFNRFSKLNSFIQGTGLGLSISKEIIEKLGGTMRAESPGRGMGSTFYFTIPYVLDKTVENVDSDTASVDQIRIEAFKKRKAKLSAQNKESKDLSMPSYKQERKKLLVVEDNVSNLQLFREFLSEKFDLVTANDGDEAVRLYAKETPDLILMDINLPYKDGYEATAEIRQLSKTVPILAVTAYAQNSDREKIMNSGFTSYLSKPVDEDDLVNEIRRFL